MTFRFTRSIGWLLFGVLLLSGYPVAAQQTMTESAAEQALRQPLDAYFSQQAASGKWFAALVLRDDSTVILNRGYGWADSTTRQPIIPSTAFAVASLTKVFTAAAILQLAAQGKLSVQDQLGTFFPNVPRDKRAITVHQLLTHTAGLQQYHDRHGDFEPMTRAQALRQILHRKLAAPVGQGYVYSNSGYTLLGLIVEQISGLDFPAYCRRYLFEPARLRETTFQGDPLPGLAVARGYGDQHYLDDQPARWPQVAGVGLANSGLLTTTQDLARWLYALQTGRLGISAETAFFPHEPSERYKSYPVSCSGYAWEVCWEPRHGYFVQMGGSDDYGFVSRVRYYPNQRLTVVLLTNSARKGHPAIRNALPELEHLLMPSFP
jgi:CubicO group peptidase (beta-lactamase class C family)